MILDQNGRPFSWRDDGLLNAVTGLGNPLKDRSLSTSFARRRSLGMLELDAIYEQQGLGARMVDLPAGAAVSEGFDVQGADGADLADVESALEDLKLKAFRRDLDAFGSLYGGAIGCLALDDGMDPIEPLDLTKIRKVEGLFVLDRWALYPIRTDHGPPEAYTIRTEVEIPIEEWTIHASRVVKFCGVSPTLRRHAELDYWGVSSIERVWASLRRLWAAAGYLEELTHDLAIDVFTIAGLREAFEQGREDAVRDRLRSMRLTKSTFGGLAMDAGDGKNRPAETYSQVARSFAGVDAIVDMFWQCVVADSGTPRSILMGETSGGALESGANAGDHAVWNKATAQRQNDLHTPWINFVLEAVFASREGPTNGVTPPEWTVAHRALAEESEKEKAETRKLRAEADQIYVDLGSASVADVRTTRQESMGVGELEAIEEPEPPPEPPPLVMPPGMMQPGQDPDAPPVDEDEDAEA